MAEEPIRLGGMALSNGVLVHGPNAWACAIRLPDGRLRGRVRPQALPLVGGHQPAAAWACPARRGDRPAAAGPASTAGHEAPLRAPARPDVDDRRRRGHAVRAWVTPARPGRDRSSSPRSRRSRPPRSRFAAPTSPPTTARSTSRSARTSTVRRERRSTSAAGRTSSARYSARWRSGTSSRPGRRRSSGSPPAGLRPWARSPRPPRSSRGWCGTPIIRCRRRSRSRATRSSTGSPPRSPRRSSWRWPRPPSPPASSSSMATETRD